MSGSFHKRRFAKRSLGQNFLVDQNIIQKIVSSVPSPKERLVIEIGPGRGALTKGLIETAGRYVAIEKDTVLCGQLAATFSGVEKAEFIEADVLEFDFEDIENEFDAKPFVVANLPYNISTPVMRRLADYSAIIAGAVLMLQKEVVDRLVARPGDKNRGYSTIQTELNFVTDRLFAVSPRAFRPVPKVDSAVILLTPLTTVTPPKVFKELVSSGFTQKRKKLANNVKAFLDKEQFLEWAAENDVSENARPADLSRDEWVSLAEKVEQLRGV